MVHITFLLRHNQIMVLIMARCMGNETMFITEFKNRLGNACCERWFSHLARRLTCKSCQPVSLAIIMALCTHVR